MRGTHHHFCPLKPVIKDDLKDIAQALCLDLQGKNQELADRIDRHLDKSPHLEKDEWFEGLFAARTKKKSAQKKRKEPTPVASGGGCDGGDVDTVPSPQRPRLHWQ